MPIYRIKCDHCGHEEDAFRSLAEYNNLPAHCGAPMIRKVCAPMVSVDIPAYKSMATGEMIEGRVAHKNHLRKNGLIEVGNEPIKPQSDRGDYNIKPEFTEAIRKHLR